MTPQEAIETIKIAIAEVEWNYDMNYTVAFEKAIKALEKQIPKKGQITITISSNKNRMVEFEHKCPNCESTHIAYYSFGFCIHCGQALDWSDI